jgi:hypothetical protein
MPPGAGMRKSCKTERAAQVELGKLLALAQDGSPTRTSPWPNCSTSTCQQPGEMCPPGKATSEIAVRDRRPVPSSGPPSTPSANCLCK